MFILIISLIVLAQNPKGGGLSSQFGGSGTSQVMGVKRTTDLLEKLTWGFFIAILILTLSTEFFIPKQSEGISSPNIEQAQEKVNFQGPSNPLPGVEQESQGNDNPLEIEQDTGM